MIQIREKNANENWQNVREHFYKSLTSPFDGMWDELVHDHSKLWGFYEGDQLVGYASKDSSGNLINFFLIEKYSDSKTDLFKRTLYLLETNQALVSTNNPDFLVLSLDKSKKMAVHSYLFENKNEVDLPAPESIKGLDISLATKSDIQNLITFCSNNVEADSDWLATYINRLVDRKEIHLLKNDGQIIGTCEVRKSTTQTSIADLGVIVDSAFRGKGIGSWLMAKAKKISLGQGNSPICSCQHTNLGSKRMIENAGFISNNMILKISF